MKCTVVFLVLSMVVLMVEPGECIWRVLFHGTRRGWFKKKKVICSSINLTKPLSDNRVELNRQYLLT
uniref:Uncharacterized protein n=1 Tax=Amphiprion percula TaxID=161767 RepID=A0A3P8SQV5_AMPPE